MHTDITDILDRNRITYRLKPHRNPVYTSEDAARERGVRLSQVVKTMLLTDNQARTVVALLPGDRRLNIRRVEQVTGIPGLRWMGRNTLETRLGLVAGAIAPVDTVLAEFPFVIDAAVFEETLVTISSGDPNAGIELESSGLRQLLKQATIADISL